MSKRFNSVCRSGLERRNQQFVSQNSQAHKLNHVVKDHTNKLSHSAGNRGCLGKMRCKIAPCRRFASGAVYRGEANCQASPPRFLFRILQLPFHSAPVAIPTLPTGQDNSRRPATVIGRSGRKPQEIPRKMSPVPESEFPALLP